MAEEGNKVERRAPTRLLVAVDKSTKGYPTPSLSSEHAFAWVLEKLIPGGCKEDFKLLILHVLTPDEDGFDDLDSVYATAKDFEKQEQLEKKRGLSLLRNFVTKSNEAQVPCEAWLRRGDPRHCICEDIQRVKPDLLVLGTRGLSKFQEIFVGSVSSHCYKNAECPVLVVRRPRDLAPSDPMDD
eukprot:TRINITY_DN141_c0_g1_i1.p1 TRINITY_DN141_c0_g1~~TRINITY_DN141_c0_g1_i1.p1  ORF type:complete len:184 (+),score=30.51 TRINITY_DN141_c0_g1_i1:102-653(+)